MTKTSIHIDLYESKFEQTFSRVKNALATNPEVLEIDLIGKGNALHPDEVLAIYYLLKERDPRTKLLTHCRTSLLGSHLLLLLMGDYRKIRKGVSVWFDDPVRLAGEDCLPEVKELKNKEGKSQAYQDYCLDYFHVCSLISEYLPLEEITDRRFELENLREYGLLNNFDEEKAFEKLFADT